MIPESQEARLQTNKFDLTKGLIILKAEVSQEICQSSVMIIDFLKSFISVLFIIDKELPDCFPDETFMDRITVQA
ncbi:hypothetical protein NBRC3257_3333 [Gluconobacter thailandicus NBRC 3257]|uniref:Transposase n=1 Tax=Gluconobacter thailandicus NBRC 3257 TaxID=1381097 RepID=A0ABQ0J1M1_GLUTH|nr:hypothetical protein NBRC3255_3083 [Gluconobacter thailandicus NBRC 3255]GAD28334.1 hypothetical protein NBRC3257_3333 [Gluconobacter thailandicus NBRC 3257]